MPPTPSPSRFPLAERAALKTLPEGVYRVADNAVEVVAIIEDYFDTATGATYQGVPCTLVARIDNGQNLPEGVKYAQFRADGKRLVADWVANDDWVRPEPLRRADVTEAQVTVENGLSLVLLRPDGHTVVQRIVELPDDIPDDALLELMKPALAEIHAGDARLPRL